MLILSIIGVGVKYTIVFGKTIVYFTPTPFILLNSAFAGSLAHSPSLRLQETAIDEIFTYLPAMGLFEVAGLISGLLCVWLLIRQSIWNWPIGLCYALVSLIVFLEARLYSEFLLHIYYVGMNAYGWYYWSRGAGRDDASGGGKKPVPVTHISMSTATRLSLLVITGIPCLAELMQYFTDADMAYADASITIFSFAAMWMTARKMIENWIVWLVVDVIATALYLIKGIELYAVLYCVYIAMAVAGWLAWRKSLMVQSAPAC